MCFATTNVTGDTAADTAKRMTDSQRVMYVIACVDVDFAFFQLIFSRFGFVFWVRRFRDELRLSIIVSTRDEYHDTTVLSLSSMS